MIRVLNARSKNLSSEPGDQVNFPIVFKMFFGIIKEIIQIYVI